MQQVRPPTLTSTSEQPPLFDGTTRLVPSPTPTLVLLNLHARVLILCIFFRLYTSYSCPFAQRVWITRNYKVVTSFCFIYLFHYINSKAIPFQIFCYFIFESCIKCLFLMICLSQFFNSVC